MSDGLSQGSDIWILTMTGKLLDLDLSSGKIRWTLDTSTTAPNLQFRTSNPASDGRRVFLASADGNLQAVDARTGQTVWMRELGSRPTTSVLLQGSTLYVGTYDKQLFGISADKGEVQFHLRLSDIPLSSLAFADKHLIFFLGEKSVAAADLGLEKILWKHELTSTLSTAKPVVWRGSVLVGDDNGEFRALDPGNGLARWSTHFPKMVRGVGVSERTLYLGTLQGTVYAWSPPESVGTR
jgi:eukaryotic-like serine/threonine-protein kinase